MITRFANLTSRLAVVFVTLCIVAACGGGGGGGDGGFIPDSGGSNLWLGIVMLDAQGNPTSTVTSTAPATIQVTVRRNGKNGKLLANIVVNGTTSLGALFPTNGSALTGANGVATFQLEVTNEKGAGSFTASASEEGGVGEASLSFQAGNTGLRLGYFDSDGDFIENEIGVQPDGVLAASGNAQLTVAILDENGDVVTSSESVRFSSACLSSAQASLSPASPVTSGNGRVETTYTAAGCAGRDEVSATLEGASAQAFTTLEIAPPSANRLDFVSAEPVLIVLKGTGGGPDRQESSDVIFQAVDSNNQPLQGIEVSFNLTTLVGGLSVSPSKAVSDADGNVKVTVFSGDVATVVRVIATSGDGDTGGEVSTVSDILTVSTGLPDQNSISLSVEDSFVVGQAMNMDGVTRSLTVRMADKFNNPVPDGTAAVFTTEYGSIDPSCETGRRNGDRLGGTPKTGECSVEWVSQAPRFPLLAENQEQVVTIYDPGYSCPSHNGNSGPCPDDLGMIRGGRSTVLVTAIGEESFIDSNGNGIFDQEEANDELFANLTEAFLDTNENSLYDPSTQACANNPDSLTCKSGREDTFADFNSNGAFDANGDDPGNGYPDEGVEAVYNGLLCPVEGNGVWCSRELVNVRDSTVLILGADPNWDIALYDGFNRVNATVTNGGPYTTYISDVYNNKPEAGSEVEITATLCEVAIQGNPEVPATSSAGAFAVTFLQDGEIEYDSCTEPYPDDVGELTITLKPQAYSETYSCAVRVIDTAPDPSCP